MIDAVILFHDLGKGTPAFQKNKMGNPNTIPTKYWGDDSSHSFYPRFCIWIFIYMKLKMVSIKWKRAEESVDCTCLGTVLCNRKTSQQFRIYGSISEKLSVESRGTAEKVERRTGSGIFPIALFLRDPDSEKYKSILYVQKSVWENRKRYCTLFFIRLEYSILVACDYYATTEFNSGFEMDCFGKADASKFREIYERSHLMESIRKYGKESYPRKKWDGKEKINILRNELFLEAEENLKAAEEDSIYL